MLTRLDTYKKKIVQTIISIVTFILILFFAVVVRSLFVHVLKSPMEILPRPVVVLLIPSLLLLVFFGFYSLLKKGTVENATEKPAFLAVIFLIAVASRFAWLWLYGDVDLQSDFALYMNLASSILENRQISLEYQWYVSYAPYVLGYSSFLAIILLLFGQSLLAVQITNCVLFGIVAVLLYLLSKKVTGRFETGVFAAFLWVVMPAAMGMTSFPQTELLFIVLMLSAIYILMGFSSHHPISMRGLRLLAAVGVLLLMNEIRPLGVLLLGSFVLFFFVIIQIASRTTKTKLLALVLFLFLVIISGSISNRMKDRFLGTDVARNAYGFGLYLGLNYETNGTWSQEDALYLDEAISEGLSAQDFHQRMIDRSAVRFGALVEERKLPSLLYHKISAFWSNPNGFLEWVSVLMPDNYRKRTLLNLLFDLSNYLYFSVLLLCLVESITSLFIRDFRFQARILFLKVIILFYFVVMAVFDNNARYLVPMLPLLFILAASGLHGAAYLLESAARLYRPQYRKVTGPGS